MLQLLNNFPFLKFSTLAGFPLKLPIFLCQNDGELADFLVYFLPKIGETSKNWQCGCSSFYHFSANFIKKCVLRRIMNLLLVFTKLFTKNPKPKHPGMVWSWNLHQQWPLANDSWWWQVWSSDWNVFQVPKTGFWLPQRKFNSTFAHNFWLVKTAWVSK